jgi:ABC-type Zn uptake system ZnuABC Zn-binding protein ZnuA
MAGLLAVVCGGNEGPPAGPTPINRESSTSSGGRLEVVTTTTILADLARNVGGDRVTVRSLVPPGVDVETFQTTPKDSIAVSRAGVIVVNGLGLDASLEQVVEGARRTGAVLVVAAEGLGTGPGESAKSGDPHLWQDPLLAIHYVERIRDGLASADPENASIYQANSDAYVAELRQLDLEIAQTLAEVPPQHRRLVTFHDAFGYFAARYRWGSSALAPSDASQVTPATIAAIVERVRSDGIPAAFAEPQVGRAVMEQVARDAGVRVGTIYSDSLDDKVTTYVEMMRYNAKSLAEHLR